MRIFSKKQSAVAGLKWVRKFVFIRSDNWDYILSLCSTDTQLSKVIANKVIANKSLDRRIRESVFQGNAAMTWDVFGQRHTGKSWWNFTLADKILRKRGLDQSENYDTIIFKIGDDIINTSSRWNKGIKHIASVMEHKHDGWRFALLQDELDPEWGEGRIIQDKNKGSAVDNLRKLKILVGFAHVKKEDVKHNLDMRFLKIGHNKKTGLMAAVLFFTRPQGIVFLRPPKELRKYLIQQYDEDAVAAVWEKAKNAFHQSTEDPNDMLIHDVDNLDDLVSFDGNRFVKLRDLLQEFWREKKGVNLSFSRLLTSFYLWSDQLFFSNSKRKITADKITMANLPLAGISKDWPETGGNSLTQARSDYKNKYKGFENTLGTHDLENIGEAFAQIVLKKELEHLNPLPPFFVRTQFRDGYIARNGKPFDLVLVQDDISQVAFNHKLMSSVKSIAVAQLDKSWGRSAHPFQVLWLTYTRPFREIYHIKLHSIVSLEGMNSETVLLWDIMGIEIGDLGAQWLEITWVQLKLLIEQYLYHKYDMIDSVETAITDCISYKFLDTEIFPNFEIHL